MLRMLAVLAVALALGSANAGAQSRTAEIRTWDGDTFRVTDPTFEVFYTIAPPPKEGNTLPDSEKRQGPGSNRGAGLMVSLEALKPLVDNRPEIAMQHHRPTDAVTLVRDGVEVRIPVEQLTSLTFFRHPVRSTLPPYLSAEHRRHTAVAVLADGSRVEGDVNLGWTYVRGSAPQGRVDVRWDRIEVVRFR